MTREEFVERIKAGKARRRAAILAGEIVPSKCERPPCGHLEGPRHDCAYVDARNVLVEAAALRRPHGDAEFIADVNAGAVRAGLVAPPGPWLAEAKRRDADELARRRRLPVSVGLARKAILA